MTKEILVVDDEKDLVGLMTKILEFEGYNVTPAYDGYECLEKIKEKEFDLILLDIMMPGMSGWDVFSRVKKMGYVTKVIFVSVLEVSEARKNMLINEGLTGYLIKPFSDDELVEVVNRALKEQKVKAI
jgi:two-component system response regulator VicR